MLKYFGFYKRFLFKSEDNGSNKEGQPGESRVPVKTMRQRKTKLVMYVLRDNSKNKTLPAKAFFQHLFFGEWEVTREGWVWQL